MLRSPSPYREAPMLETARLRLRALRVQDFAAYAAIWADPDVVRYVGCEPNSREQAWTRLLHNAGHWAVMGFGWWLVEEKDSDEFVGEAGLFQYERDIEPSLGQMPEVGWALTPAKQGLGYATEAVQAILRWGDGRFIAESAACLIEPDNAASLRVAQRCGFQASHLTTFRGRPSQVLLRRFDMPMEHAAGACP